MDDTRNYIERAQARMLARDGRELTLDDVRQEVRKTPLNDRVEIVDELHRDTKMRGDESLSVREAAQRMQNYDRYVATYLDEHERLRRVGR